MLSYQSDREIQKEESKKIRFGHTFTFVSKSIAVLFGGGVKNENGTLAINSDTIVYDDSSNDWSLVKVSGNNIPTARAAHAATSIYLNQLVIYGGSQGSRELADDKLYLLEINEDYEGEWMTIPVKNGVTPGKRYGHTMTFQNYTIILFGGTGGGETFNDLWVFPTDSDKLEWNKIQYGDSFIPVPRTYHACSLSTYGKSVGEIFFFGGRGKDEKILNDLWSLKLCKDRSTGNFSSSWKLIKTKTQPKERNLHTTNLYGNFLVNLGGRSNENDNLPIEILNLEDLEWRSYSSLRRYRHRTCIAKSNIIVYGGLSDEKENLKSVILRLEMHQILKGDKDRLIKLKDLHSKKSNKEVAEAKKEKGSPNSTTTHSFSNQNNLLDAKVEPLGNPSLAKMGEDTLRMSNKAEIAISLEKKGSSLGDLVKKISIDKLSKKKLKKEELIKSLNQSSDTQDVHDKVIKLLLKPKEWIGRSSSKDADNDTSFILSNEVILHLVKNCYSLLESQPTLLNIEAPIKIFGDIHGQYQDLMRFFDLYKAPIEGPNGDIAGTDYLFLGDFVDRGKHSLETICLLMALKLKYPTQIHLIRGNHEDRRINMVFGFYDECIRRCNDDPENPLIFNKINDMFDMLPLGAVINKKVLCVHGGVGLNLTSLEDIKQIKRPVEVVHEVTNNFHQILVDILWSDPTSDDSVTGIHPNIERDQTGMGNIVKYGPDRVEHFLKSNNLSNIIRAHECVMDGFERFANGSLLTVFSATDYCGRYKNAGAFLFLTNKFEIKPYLIYPYDGENDYLWSKNDKRSPTPPRNYNKKTSDRKNSFD